MCTHTHTQLLWEALTSKAMCSQTHTHTQTPLLQEGSGGSGQQVVLESPPHFKGCMYTHTHTHTHTHTPPLLQEGSGGSGQQVVLESPSHVLNFPTSPRVFIRQMINSACVEGREREVCVKFWYRPHRHHTREQNTASSPMVSTPPTPQSTQALPPSGHFWAQLLPDHSIPMALWLHLQYPASA